MPETSGVDTVKDADTRAAVQLRLGGAVVAVLLMLILGVTARATVSEQRMRVSESSLDHFRRVRLALEGLRSEKQRHLADPLEFKDLPAQPRPIQEEVEALPESAPTQGTVEWAKSLWPEINGEKSFERGKASFDEEDYRSAYLELSTAMSKSENFTPYPTWRHKASLMLKESVRQLGIKGLSSDKAQRSAR